MGLQPGSVDQAGIGPSRLDALRAEIDRIDDELLALVAQRLSRTKAIAELKHSADRSTLLLRPDRERELLERLKRSSAGLPPFVVEAIWREIMACSLQLQQVTELALHAAERPGQMVDLVRHRFGCAAPLRLASSAEEALERARLHPAIAAIELSPGSNCPGSDWWVGLAEPGTLAIFDWLVGRDDAVVGLLVGRCDESCRLPDLSFAILSAEALDRRIASGEPIRELAASGERRLAVSTARSPDR